MARPLLLLLSFQMFAMTNGELILTLVDRKTDREKI